MAWYPTHSISKHEECSTMSHNRRVERRYLRREEESKFSTKELEVIREQYMGTQKAKKRVTKPSEKFRFSFDWQRTEDTSQDTKPLYERPHDARLVFGRGMDRFAIEPHWSEKEREKMTQRDWRIFGEDHNISYKGSHNHAQPMRNWEESELIPELIHAVHKVGYQEPSPIQMAAIPFGNQLQDMIGVAETGSGKIVAFVLPMLTYVSKLPKATPEDGPHAIVMAPTRELVMQIASETGKFAQFLKGINICTVSIVGGQSIEEQSQKLQHGCEIVIATPGRLLDCLERRYAVLNECKYVVLDEADRMIDMGFEEQVTAILDAMPSSNQKPEIHSNPYSPIHRTTVMFSATMPPAVERIARKYLRDPVIITIGSAGQTTDLISQTVFMLQEHEKLGQLRRLLSDKQSGNRKTIIFVNTRYRAETLTRDLDRSRDLYHVASLHGGKVQHERESILEKFRTSKSGSQCLIATDVAGRGIDIPDVARVVNYDMPETIEKYTHRIGRTGRAGKRGEATTFLTPGDSAAFRDLMEVLVRSGSQVPPQLARQCRALN